jgi:predicted ribosome quality control (RQC) complex YloA/Tae2 family protein
LQPVDFTTLSAICVELRQTLLPARLEQVYQPDRWRVCLALRTLTGRQWLTLSWHPQAARICLEGAPPKLPDPFNFSQQIWHQIGNLALVEIELIAPWERVVDLRFAQRPGDPVLWHLYVEIMGQYSNVVLVNRDNQIVTAAYQVGERQSRLRSLQTGALYEQPPTLVLDTPSLTESFVSWWEKITLIPGKLSKNLTSVYRGLSTALVKQLLEQAEIDVAATTETITPNAAARLFQVWQNWLELLQTETFSPAQTATGYTVLGHAADDSSETIQTLIANYYRDHLAQQTFQQLQQQLQQRLSELLKKLDHKRQDFHNRLQDSDQAEQVRQQADLLMAYLHLWQPGMQQIELVDFTTNQPRPIPLSPDKNAVQNAQALYKRHQKLKRSRAAILPLLASVQTEMDYLGQILTAVQQLSSTQAVTELPTLEEIREELVQSGYMKAAAIDDFRSAQGHRRPAATSQTAPYRFTSPSGYEVLVGRNNRQNDHLTFRLATDYDLWFHSQQIPGSHVLLRLPPGSQPEPTDLQFTANLAAYYSQARASEQVPIVYTHPKHVYKPKGAKLGMVIYKQETVLWGEPQKASLTPPRITS